MGLTLAHQYLSQFERSKVDALSTVGTSLIFRVDARDAQYLTKNLMGALKPEQLTKLAPREVIGRIGSRVVSFTTDPIQENPSEEIRTRIINLSREKYYRSVEEATRSSSSARENSRGVALSTTVPGQEEEFLYDEF